MIRSREILLLIVFVAISFSWIACEKERDPCLQPTVMPVRFGTYQPADTGSLGRDTTLPAAVVGLADTPVLWYYGSKANKFSIVFSPIADSVRWIIAPDTNDRTNGTDTITFYYDRKVQFLSTGCGYTYFYTIKNIATTNKRIDSVKITGTEVTSDAKIEHVKIFY